MRLIYTSRYFVARCSAFAALAAVLFVPGSTAADSTYSSYLSDKQTWIIGNTRVEVAFQLQSDGRFRYRWIRDNVANHEWQSPDSDPGSPINLTVGGAALDGNTSYTFQSYSFSAITKPATGKRFTIVLKPASASGEVRFQVDIYNGQPFVRYGTMYTNQSASPVAVTQANMLAWTFNDGGETFRDFNVGEWEWYKDNFNPHEKNLSAIDTPIQMRTGAAAADTSWRVVLDSHGHGLVAGWEFDGRASAHAQHHLDSGLLSLDAQIEKLNHPVLPNEVFKVPDAFIGVFDGGWDEAGYRTQRFVEDVLAVPVPDKTNFPYAMFDTWGYGQNVNEAKALRWARIAADEGAEVFILDLGWARAIGDWYPDPVKFPQGLKALSNYVHSRGMKFGLHVPFLQAAPNSPALLNHPDWQADDNGAGNYFGAVSLCPSHKPVHDWIISELNRIINDYGVDWLTQDGNNMVKICNSTTHTHAPGDSNYANAINGLDDILIKVQAAHPGVLWENCEDGGSMQTFHMVQRYVTSITTDAIDALTTRQGIYGALYPFPPRYTERYMADSPSNTYETRSYMFGGPFIMMNRIASWSQNTRQFVKREIGVYKSLRATIRDSKIYQLTPRPDGTFDDAIEAYNPQVDEAVIFIYGAAPTAWNGSVRPRGLNPNTLYYVAPDGEVSYLKSGRDLMSDGIAVNVQPATAEIVTIAP